MVKRYLMAGLWVVFFCVSSSPIMVGDKVVFAETEVILKDSTTASGFSVKDSSGNTIMRARGDGNVGIGTTAPSEKLEVNGTVKATDFVGDASGLTGISGGIPQGGIIMWSGSIASIPDGWFLCDGTSVVTQSGDVVKTPNLTDRFIIHADADSGGTRNVGDTGGAHSVTLTQGQTPLKDHLHLGHSRAPGSGGWSYSLVLGRSNQGIDATTASNANQSVGDSSAIPHENMPKYYALAFIIKI